jgi:hypothetical protein
MKTKELLLLGTLSLALAAGCSTKEDLTASAIAPAAKGEVKVNEDRQDNSEVTVKVQHLAPPEKFYPGATNYTVWIQPSGSDTFQNVGALKVDDDLEGEYKTTVPYKDFRVLVTPEMGNMAQAPTGPTIFDQKVTR